MPHSVLQCWGFGKILDFWHSEMCLLCPCPLPAEYENWAPSRVCRCRSVAGHVCYTWFCMTDRKIWNWITLWMSQSQSRGPHSISTRGVEFTIFTVLSIFHLSGLGGILSRFRFGLSVLSIEVAMQKFRAILENKLLLYNGVNHCRMPLFRLRGQDKCIIMPNGFHIWYLPSMTCQT